MFKFFGLLLLGSLLSACTIVSPGERGVRYHFGSMSENVLEPGIHAWVPFVLGTSTFNVQIQPIEVTTSSGTKDQQEVSTSVTVNLQIDPTKVTQIVRESGGEWSLLDRIKPLAQESVNAVISKYTAEELLTKRSDVKKAIEELVKEQIGKYGVIVHDIALKDMQYSQEYSQAIERKQVAEQQAKQAEYVTQKAEQDAKAAIATAKGEAEANRLKQQSITKELLQLEAIKRWSGQVPQVLGGGNNMLFNIPMGTGK